jgi:hypothetical protein
MPYTPPVYPTSIPSTTDLPDRADDVDTIYAARYNELKKELLAALTELGTLPKGAFDSVKLRLDDVDSQLSALSPTYAKTIITEPIGPDMIYNGYGVMDDNTIAHVCKVKIPFAIKANHFTIDFTDGFGTASTLKIGLYALDGQTKLFEFTSVEIDGAGVYKTTLGAETEIPAGVYYMVIINVTSGFMGQNSIFLRQADLLANETPDESPSCGVIFDCAAGTLPATFDPLADIWVLDGDGGILRFDN